MPSTAPFEEHRKLLLSFAQRVKRRLHAAGARSVQFEDIFQELVCAWCKARDKWEPQHQVPFGAYLMRGMSNHINRWVQQEINQHIIAPFDMEFEIEEGVTLHEVVADKTQILPEEEMIMKDLHEYAFDPLRWRSSGKNKPLSESARKFLELLGDPPPQIQEALRAIQARVAYGHTALNINTTVSPTQITASLIMDLLGVDRTERTSIRNEIKALGERINQQ